MRKTLPAAAGLASCTGGDLMDGARIDRLKRELEREVALVRAGGACVTPCAFDSTRPLRIAFRLDGDEGHWNDCYDESDLTGNVDEGYSLHRPPESMRVMVDAPTATFGRRPRHTFSWGEHWFGCSTNPWIRTPRCDGKIDAALGGSFYIIRPGHRWRLPGQARPQQPVEKCRCID